ncbi:SIS domain-containing protein [Phytohabitans sp. ZYX-F-186]|uniref:SIS domain-containing protein n=1 Tax=Phytohabitans maris TaxID=3071409 RepID=A0ABU0ZVZ7_9ACTN|nr:SIS domain-containing protein [Phytohabitans sp. ZYX-F-186]MDQ7911201.1 SIS domain-containing protein [Phytohabitans sp. ZYX-F-186]
MNEVLHEHLDDHLTAVAAVRDLVPEVVALGEEICRRLERGGTVYTFGNGGSAADAQHFAAELVGRYLRDRRPLPAIALSTDPSVTTCIGNDYSYASVFSRQVTALVRSADVVIGFSTSGTSPSVVEGLAAARRNGALTVLFTGEKAAGSPVADRVLPVASRATARIQEGHVLLLHMLSELIDRWAAGGG